MTATARLVAVSLLVVVGMTGGAATTGFVGAAAADAPNCSGVSYGGSGTSGDPYQVDSVDKLQCIGKDHGDATSLSDALSSNYKLTADIDAGETSTWNGGKGFDPVGDGNNQFTGTFDGNGYDVTSLDVSRSGTDYVGLFASVGNGGVVNGVGVSGTIHGQKYVGGLVGYSSGEVRRSTSSATVAGSGNQVGGLVGESQSHIEESYATGSVDGGFDVGGLVGKNDGTIRRSYATGSVSGTSTLGGLVGNNAANGDVDSSYWDTSGYSAGTDSNSIGSFSATGLTTTEMQRFAPQSNMGALDFENTWTLTSGYPSLTWEGDTAITVDSVSAADVTVTSDSGTIEVTANEGGGDAGEGAILEVTNADGLAGISNGDTATTNTNGVATFTFSGAGDGTYTPEFAWTDDTSVKDTATVTVDTTAPSVSGVAVSDDTDANGVVADGDTIQITATVTDANGIASVDADASAFDAGTVTLTDDGPNSDAADDQYSTTVTVGGAPTEGDQSVTVSATDEAGNGGSQSVASGTITVDTTAPTLSADSGSTDEDTSATIVADLLANDNDATSLSVSQVEGSGGNVGSAVAGGNGGAFTVASDGTVDFDPSGEFEPLAGGDSDTTQVTVTVADAAGNTDTQTVTATVNGANDAPTLTVSTSDPTFTEGGSAVSVFSTAHVDVFESGQQVQSLTVTVDNVADGSAEVLTVDGSDVALTDGTSVTTATNGLSASVSVTSGTATVTVSGGFGESTANSVIDGLTYEHTGDDPSAASDRVVTVTEVVDDGGTVNGGSDTWTGSESGTISLTAVNDAPTLSTDARSLDSVSEDDTGNGGTTVSTVLASAGTTGDAEGATLGVAVTGVDDTDGAWEYSTDGGSSWSEVASASPADSSALLLAAGDSLRFVPNADVSGSAGGSVTLRAWDGTSGVAGDTTADASTNGGTTAFSADAASASVTVDDAPEVSAITRATGESNPTSSDSVDFEVAFTESVSGVDTTDFTATGVSGDVSGSVSAVSGTGSSYTVTVDSVAGDGDLRLDLDDDDSVTAADNGVALGGAGVNGGPGDGSFAAGQAFTVDSTVPSVGGVSAVDATDGNSVVASGDTVQITATVTDSNAVTSVEADASAFDAGAVTLTDDGPNSDAADDQYSAALTVGSSPTEGDQSVTVGATDETDNGGSQAVGSGVLAVDVTAPTLAVDSGTTDEDTAAEIVADLLANDGDANTPLTVTEVDGSAASVGSATAGDSGGLFTVAADGTVDFDPDGAFETLGVGESATSQVTVTVADAAGNADTQTVTATVTGVNDAPAAVASSDATTTDEGETVDFDATGSDDVDGDALTYDWDVDGDGTDEYTDRAQPAHQYDTPGTFTVTLTVDDGTVTDTDTLTVTVADVTGPTADAGDSRVVEEDTHVDFDGTGSSDNVGVTGYEWDFDGDGETDATGAQPSHTFADPGTYTVGLTVADDAGNTATDAATVTVTDATDPVADASNSPGSGDEDAPVTFDGRASSDNVGVTKYEWTFGDGATATGATPTHTYPEPGTYTVRLRVTDAAGLTDTDTRTLTVADTTRPHADAGPDVTVDEGVPVTFDGSGSSDNVGVASYAWDVDADGLAEASGDAPTYTYADPGTYEVELGVTDAAGNFDFDTVVVTVRDATAPAADAGPNRTVEVGSVVRLDGSGSSDNGEVGSFEWDLDGDGTTDLTGPLANGTFDAPGTYRVTLTVTDAAGNSDTDAVTVTVTDRAGDATPPTADAGANQTVANGTQVTLDGSNSTDDAGIASAVWDLDGDGIGEATGLTVAHTFPTAGTYHVRLRITDAAGNSDTDAVTVTVTDQEGDDEDENEDEGDGDCRDHASGVCQQVFDAVAGADGTLDRDDVVAGVAAYVATGSVDGVALTRADVLALVAYYVGQG